MTARRIGLQASGASDLGQLSARADIYRVSDGNTVTTANLRYTPSWRPLGSNFKPMFGIEARNAKFNTLDYWSPDNGYGSAFAGLMGEWGTSEWNFFAAAQIGVPLYGETGTSWSVSSGGKRWLNKDWAMGVNFWAMASQRDKQAYRAHSLYFTVEKLW
jgi:hypothetical protein